MKSKIVNDGEFTIVEFSGYLDFEAANPACDTISKIYKENNSAKVIINLRSLNFVGSSGISSFVKSLRDFNHREVKPSYYGVRPEFLKMFRLFEDAEPFHVVDTAEDAKVCALERYNQWQANTLRSRRNH